MRIGNLRDQLTFERQTATQDLAGQPQQTWTTIVKRMCSMEPLNGREFLLASGEKSDVTTRIRARYDGRTGTIRPYDRAVDYSQSPAVVYNILSVINPRERNREVIFMCRRDG